jgi:hypothetical protein
VHRATVEYGSPLNKSAKRRDRKKTKKIDCLEQVELSPRHVIKKEVLESKPVFFSGTWDRIVPNRVPNSLVLSAIQDLQVVDTVEGARMILENGDIVFILIPRLDSISRVTNVNKILATLYGLEKRKTTSEKRGKKRIPVSENGGKYGTIGLKPNRGSPGICDSWPKKMSRVEKDQIVKLMRSCQDVANGFIPSNKLRGIQIARLLQGWDEMDGGTSQSIWGSLAYGRNHYLNAHTDEDFFYSVITIHSPHGLRNDIDRYHLHAKICNYFAFPEQGRVVGLRPGDIIIINPRYGHCLSSRTSMYETRDVFSMSMYLKTAIVGKNDNSLPLTETDESLLE